ncbi:FtsW/RodA/SpoVE family cell cycle protein, partial [Lysobacter sp. 2RAB21]
RDLHWAMYGYIASQMVIAVGQERSLRRYRREHGLKLSLRATTRADWSVLWRLGLPSSLAGLLTVPAMWLVMVMLSHTADGATDLGHFALGNQARSILLFGIGVVANAALPMLSSALAQGDRHGASTVLRHSMALLLAITAGMLVLGGVNMPRMFGPVLIGLPVLAVIAIAEPYRVVRLTSFLNPWVDPFGTGSQLTNALMAVGRGEWTGVGLGASVQKLSYLPEAHTDFIMAVIAEEFGFVGVCAVVGLYMLLSGRALWIGLKCVEMRRHFSGYVAFGIALWMGLQSFV